MPALSHDLTARVAKFLPRLASDQIGEVAATAAAITRILKADGHDLHDLAAHVAEPRTVVYKERPAERQGPRDFDPGPIRPFDTYAWKRAFTPKQELQHRRQVAYCQAQRSRLSPREREFIDGIARLRGNISVRQADWLGALTDRLENVGRCA